jgi:hypothetical protein
MDLWFGDSWAIGAELGINELKNRPGFISLKQRAAYILNKQDGLARIDNDCSAMVRSNVNSTSNVFDRHIFPNVIVGLDNPLMAFPAFVSAHRNQQYINFAKNGSSVQFALHQLVTFCSSNADKLTKTTTKYTAFLCLTALVRSFGINSITNNHHHWHNNNIKSDNNTVVYDSLMAINCFYATCKMYNIDCVIIPIWCDLTIPDNTTFNELILFNNSILSHTSLVELTFSDKFFVLDFSSTNIEVAAKNFSIDIKSKEWITPNTSHPNELGHKKLAHKLIELLENR